ncbi:GlxA family transcriptional regulator [Actinokineospora iranica]|uniref:Transcriptional regulator GlxA family, contains an amidase domain and an AraC-type DNA-binding HTH domain n=1 Tax=Actinokineospora iranica TaxID=1271860 RepID=A0A1G6XQI7_9PSEU|nr:helix-turn-helix domain-containing protein [Actinokineospora iranica]SDD80464.1 Transcriptional regulator GlxA family, contains an amidase domain and an AraC-type DNA-binding HTH domain [Actinokineospora iranica]
MIPGPVALAVVNGTDMQACEVYETAIANAVFGDPQPDLADSWYELRLCAVTREPRPTASGFSIRTQHGLDDLVTADTVIVPSVPDSVLRGGTLPPEFIEALRAAARAGARMVSLCTGAFALAEAGLLDGRRATAHWMHTADLAKRYPGIHVEDSVLYVDDGDVLTSAGMSAGLDLCLHLVRRDLGAHVAGQLARRMVVAGHRPGGQAQFVDLTAPDSDDDTLAMAMDWAARNLDRPLTVDELAKRAGMSTRTFFRRLRASTGLTPLKWLLNQRISRAQSLLETTALPIERISAASGLGTAANLRRHFTTHVGVTPTDYRHSLGGGKRGPARTAGARTR